ncbi:MAG TPA: radical SAM protein [Syntrophomonadaceae bacterium]|nr:radical SAM protein [Syntrophomonadaceae bacterium]
MTQVALVRQDVRVPQVVPAVQDVQEGAAAVVAAETEEHKRFTIQWHITERCNCHCLHCYQEEVRTESTATQLEQTHNEIQSFLKCRPGIITITGGEPLLHPGFFNLLAKLEQPFGILSNGTLIDPAMASRLAEHKPSFIQVSIEGREKTHDSIRGRGSFRAAVEGIKNLVRSKHRVLISFTAHQRNYRELPAVARLGRKLGADKVWVDRLIPAGSGNALQGLAPDQNRELFSLMRKSQVAMDRALQFLAGGQPYRCQAGRSLMAILPNGDVLPCRRMPIVAGNLMQNTLEEIYQQDIMQNLRQDSGAKCSGCLYQQICQGGLRCLAYALTGSPFAPDPGCWIANSIQEGQEKAVSPMPAIIVPKSWLRRW